MINNGLINAVAVSLAACFLTGCSSFRNSIDSIGKWNADPITISYPEDIDLLVLLSQESEPNASLDSSAPQNYSYGKAVEISLAAAEKLNDSEYKAKRRVVLESLVRKSNSLCHKYKLDLVRKQARGNFVLGTSALLFGTAGAIATHAGTARALAGSAAFATGTQSQLNQDYYFERTAAVLSKAIDKRREIQLRLIQASMDLPKATYTMRGAITDVETYHSTCSLTGAISELEKAVDTINVLQSVEAAANAAGAYARIRTTISSQPASSPPSKE